MKEKERIINFYFKIIKFLIKKKKKKKKKKKNYLSKNQKPNGKTNYREIK